MSWYLLHYTFDISERTLSQILTNNSIIVKARQLQCLLPRDIGSHRESTTTRKDAPTLTPPSIHRSLAHYFSKTISHLRNTSSHLPAFTITAPMPSFIKYNSTAMSRSSPSKATKSYLNRPDPVRQESQAQRRSLIKKSLQAFLANDAKQSTPTDTHPEHRSTQRLDRSPNCISSMFLSPRQKQRAKALKKKKKEQNGRYHSNKKNRKVSRSTISPEKSNRTDLKEYLSDTEKSLMMTTILGVGLFASKTKELPRNDVIEGCSTLQSASQAKTKDVLTSPLSPRKLLSPRRSPRKVVISKNGSATVDEGSSTVIIEQLPFADEFLDNKQIDHEENLHGSIAIDYIDGADWANLEWNAILPSNECNASMHSFRSEKPRKRGSLTHNKRISRRASCNAIPNSGTMQTKNRRPSNARSVGRQKASMETTTRTFAKWKQ